VKGALPHSFENEIIEAFLPFSLKASRDGESDLSFFQRDFERLVKVKTTSLFSPRDDGLPALFFLSCLIRERVLPFFVCPSEMTRCRSLLGVFMERRGSVM